MTKKNLKAILSTAGTLAGGVVSWSLYQLVSPILNLLSIGVAIATAFGFVYSICQWGKITYLSGRGIM